MTYPMSSMETMNSLSRSGSSEAADKPGNLTHYAVKPTQGEHIGVKEETYNQLSILETADNQPSSNSEAKIIVSFTGHGDVENPVNWSRGKKIWVVIVGIIAVINSTWNSALPSGATEPLAKYFNISSQEQLVLPISLYLVGYASGPLIFGPLSEDFGRRLIMISTFGMFTIFTMACALAPTWPSLLVFRWLVGVFASSSITIVGGLYADVYDDPVTRGRAMAIFMAATTFGPQLAPGVSGFVSVVSWRWSYWAGFIVAGLSMVALLLLPETYGPVLLKKRAHELRKSTGNNNVFAPIELEKKGARKIMTITLARPFQMFFSEAIVLLTCLYLSLAYAIFYMYFEAYPLIFQGIYSMNAGVAGLAFLPIAIGACFACGIFLYYESIHQKAKKHNARWSIEEYRRLPLACLGGPLIVVSLFWLGWTASPHIHWIVPMLGGIFFGTGYLLIFMALLNYLTDAYQVFAASAMAAATCCRSIFGAALPFAATPMYSKLGIAWASSLLGFLSLGMTIIPFAFVRYGDKIRANSQFCQRLQKENSLRGKENHTDVTVSSTGDSRHSEKV